MSAAGGAPTANRRDFLRGSAAAGAVILLGARPDGAAAEPPPETTTIRIGHSPSLCAAPQAGAQDVIKHARAFVQPAEDGAESVNASWRGSRRSFLGGLAVAGLAGLDPRAAGAEPPPETTTLRVAQFGSLCVAPQYVAEELLRAEGFTRIEYPQTTGGEVHRDLGAGRIHLSLGFVGPAIVDIDRGVPLVFLAGVHPGCYEVFGSERIRTNELRKELKA